MKKVLLFLAKGFEEVEAVTPIDFLRRAGIEVTTIGIGGRMIDGAHGISIEADTVLPELEGVEAYDGLVFPGGMPGAENIAADERVLKLVNLFHGKGKLIAAICASPAVVLAGTGVLNGRQATCYPGFENKFGSEISFSSERVVRDGNIITSRGPGTAAEFAVELIRYLADEETAIKIKEGTLQAF